MGNSITRCQTLNKVCVLNRMLSEVHFNKFTFRIGSSAVLFAFEFYRTYCVIILLNIRKSKTLRTALQSRTSQINQKVIGYCSHVANPFQFTINVHYTPFGVIIVAMPFYTPRHYEL